MKLRVETTSGSVWIIDEDKKTYERINNTPMQSIRFQSTGNPIAKGEFEEFDGAEEGSRMRVFINRGETEQRVIITTTEVTRVVVLGDEHKQSLKPIKPIPANTERYVLVYNLRTRLDPDDIGVEKREEFDNAQDRRNRKFLLFEEPFLYRDVKQYEILST